MSTVVDIGHSSAENLVVRKIALSHIFCFDFGSEEVIPFLQQGYTEKIKTFTEGIYFLDKGEIDIKHSESSNFLKIYKSDMYERRFKNSVLSQRKTAILKFPKIKLNGILHKNSEIISKEKLIFIDVTATLNEIGIGTLVFWIEFDDNFTFDDLFKLRDISELNSSVDFRSGDENKLRLQGDYSFIEIAKFIITSLLVTKKSDYEIRRLQAEISQGKKIGDLYKRECDNVSSDLRVSDDINFYPIYHFDYTNEPTMTKEKLQEFIFNNKAIIRGLTTGDVNWDKKNQKVIDNFYEKFSFSTRDSIKWYTHPNGSTKIYSYDLETPLVTSKVLITFELEIILTMKFFLYKLIQNLNHFAEMAKSSYPIRSLAKLKDKEMRKLDDYYSLDFLQKDTTISRISKFRKMMNIDMILEIAEKKIDSLNTYTTTEYQDAIGLQQLILTVVFGMFGAGNLTFVILDSGIKSQIYTMNFNWIIGITVISMVISTIIILYLFRKKRIN